MFKIILVTFFLLFGITTPAQGDWYIIQEPTLDKLIEWVPEEVPRTVSFYFDTDGDGMFDLKIAYSLIEAFACKENCVRRIIDNGDHWILPAPGVNYFVIKKWIVYRYFGDEDWRGVEKTNQYIFENQYNKDWYKHEFKPIWPDR